MKIRNLDLGAMPVDKFNDKCGFDLEEGRVVISRNAIKHVRKKRPKEFERYFKHLEAVIANPLLIGDDHRNPGKVEIVGRVPGLPDMIMIAISVEIDDHGNYHVASFYHVYTERIQNRRDKGILKSAL